MRFESLKNRLTARGVWKGAVIGSDNTDPITDPVIDPPATDPVIDPPVTDPVIDPPKLSDKEAELLKDLMKQKQKNKDSEAALLGLKGELAKFEGINLDEIKELLAQKKDSETKKLEDQGQWDLLKRQMAEENGKIVKVHADKSAGLQALVDSQQSLINKLTLGHSFNTSPFILNELNLSSDKTRIIYGAHFELDGDKVVAYDKPKGAADRVQLVDASGEPLGFEDSIRKLIEADPDKDRLIKSKAKPGSGSAPSSMKVDLSAKTEAKGVDRISKGLDAQKK